MSEQEAWVPRSDSIESISSDGLESPRPGRLNSADARSESDKSYADIRNVLMAEYLSVVGGEDSSDTVRVAVEVSKAATT